MKTLNTFGAKAFSLNFTGLINRIISDIAISEVFDPQTPPAKRPQHLGTTASWDTGATQCIITRDTALKLNLKSVGKVIANHGGGASEHSTHLVNLILPNQVGLAGVQVIEMEHIQDNFGVIIGMDIISQGDFSITNFNGKTCFSFRTPSLHKIDYVEEWNKKFKNVRPNDFCPCGADKKFRKCHGAPGSATLIRK